METPQRLSAAQEAQAARLATSADKLDIFRRKYSYGPKTGAISMVNEHSNARSLEWKISNKTASAQVILFSTLFSDTEPNTTIFQNVDAILEVTNSNVIFKDGKLVDGTDAADLVVTSIDPQRDINQFLRYAGQSGLRFVKWAMESRKASTGAGESSNYSNKIKSYWFTPFDDPDIRDLNMRTLQIGGDNVNRDMLDIDFIAQNFRAMLTNEHFLQITVNPDTELTITAFVGAQDSRAQDMWRFLNHSDAIIRREKSYMK